MTQTTGIEEMNEGGGRILPHSPELEMQVLGACMLSRQATLKVMALADAQAFYRGRHRHIFDAIVRLYEDGKPADLSLLAEELEQKGVLAECGGPAYLADLAASVGTSANVEFHTRALIEKAVCRRTITLATRLTKDCFDATGDVYESLESFQHELLKLTERKWQEGYRPVAHFVDAAYADIEFAKGAKHSAGISSGIGTLDAITGGFRRGEYIIIAARPRVGKTAVCLNIAAHAAILGRIPVAILSLEMNGKSLAKRLLAITAGVSTREMDRGDLSDEQWTELAHWSERIQNAPLWIDDGTKQTPAEIRVRAQRMVDEHKVQMIVVDYLGLIKPPISRRDAHHQEVSDISGELKAMAKDLNVALLVCSQITRESENEKTLSASTPRLSHLRDSGSVEQDADVVIFIHRPEAFGFAVNKKTNEDLRGKGYAIVAKQRNGPTGTANLWWEAEYTRFRGRVEEKDAPEMRPVAGDDEDDEDSPFERGK